MTNLSDLNKRYRTSNATATAADIATSKIAYINGGRVVGGGTDPTPESGEPSVYRNIQDADAVAADIAAGTTAYITSGLVVGTQVPSAAVSVELVEVTIAAGSSLTATVALTKSQNAAQCAPFYGGHYPSTVTDAQSNYSDQNQVDVDIWDDAGTAKVTVTRRAASSAAAIKMVVYVVEFVVGVRVQKIYTSAASSAQLTWTETISAIDQARTFVIYSQRDNEIGGLYAHESMLQTSWDSDTVIRFTRETGTGMDMVKATVWIVEDVSSSGEYFTVTRYTHSSNALTSNKTITAVAAMNKTMIIADWSVPGSYTQAHYVNMDVQLTSTTNLQFYRETTNVSNSCTIYVVEWQNVTTVQRGLKTYTPAVSSDTLQTWTQSITAVDDTASIVKKTTNRYRQWSNVPSQTWYQIPAMNSIKLDAGGAGITGTYHGNSSATQQPHDVCWEVIQF